MSRKSRSNRFPAAFAGSAAACLLGLTDASAQELLYLEAHSRDLTPQQNQQSPFFQAGGSGYGAQQICGDPGGLQTTLANAASNPSMQLLLGSQYTALLGDAFEASIEALQQYCGGGEPSGVDFFSMVYASCRMTMQSGSTTTDVRFPEDGSGAMEMIEHARRQGIVQPFALAQAAAQVAQGVSIEPNFTETGATDTLIGYSAGQWEFDQTLQLDMGAMLSMGGGGMNAQQLEAFGDLIGTPTVTIEGTAWIAENAPGVDTLSAFYETFSSVMAGGQAGGALMSGLMMPPFLKGLPLVVSTTTTIDMGSGGGLGAFAQGFMPQQEPMSSEMTFTRVETLDMPDGYCDNSVIPEDYSIVNPLEELSSGAGGPGGQAPQIDPDEINQGLSAINEALENMTPEQQQAFEQFGQDLGGFLGGALGNQGNPGGAQPSAPGGGTGGGFSSQELMTDDLLQTAQNMLQALGYNPGNTDGEESALTTIAISQFQAEQGLEVTGEVTPQLIGVLAATVDATL